MKNLSKRQCVPCKTDAPPLKGIELQNLKNQLDPSWQLNGEHHLEKCYTFKNFKDALAFVNDVGHIAEEESHHPDIEIAWDKVKLKLWTHKIDGLSESDFILAAKCDAAQIGRFG